MRPKELADDYTIADRVVRHALDWLTSGGYSVNYLCWIYPTAPFIRPEHIRQGAELIWAKKVSQVFSVTDFPYPIFRALRITEHGNLSMFWPEHDKTRSQDLPKAYHDAGQFYWVEVERFRRMKCAIAEDAFPVLIPRDLVQDIDTPEDWEIAERMFRARAK